MLYVSVSFCLEFFTRSYKVKSVIITLIKQDIYIYIYKTTCFFIYDMCVCVRVCVCVVLSIKAVTVIIAKLVVVVDVVALVSVETFKITQYYFRYTLSPNRIKTISNQFYWILK